VPATITSAGSAANEAAIKSYNAEHGTAIAMRQRQYLNHIIEQEHRGVPRVPGPMLGCKSFEAAQATLMGLELMPMLHKGQREGGVEQGRTAAEQFYTLASSLANRPRELPSSRRHTNICDTTGKSP
jgi:putative transposase